MLFAVTNNFPKVGNYGPTRHLPTSKDRPQIDTFSHRSLFCFWHRVEEISGNHHLEDEKNRSTFSYRKRPPYIEIARSSYDLQIVVDQ